MTMLLLSALPRHEEYRLFFLGQCEGSGREGCKYAIILQTREATRKTAASHTRSETRKCFLGTILILSHV